MLEEDPTARNDAAEELLRRALLDDSSSAAVSLKVSGLPLSDAVTVIFHGRRDLGTLQTYVTRGTRGAGAIVSAGAPRGGGGGGGRPPPTPAPPRPATPPSASTSSRRAPCATPWSGPTSSSTYG